MSLVVMPAVLRPALAAALLLALCVHAAPGPRPQDILEDPAPGAIAPFPLAPADFEVRWVGAPLPGVEVALDPGRLQWIRTGDVLVVPRARLLVSAREATGGTLLYADTLHPLVGRPGDLRAAIPVALVSGERNLVTVRVKRGGETVSGQLALHFRPRRAQVGSGMEVDPSCSPYALTVEASGTLPDAWGYVGCRLVTLEGESDRTSSLELAVLWDNMGESIEVAGVDTPATAASVWRLRLPPGQREVALSGRGQSLTLRYHAPEHPRRGFVGIGVGPYAYAFRAPGERLDSTSPVITLYGSYALGRSARVVSFGIIAPSSRPFGDLGLYLRSESFTLFDKRVGVAVFLGGHVSAFRHASATYSRVGFPQGAEVVWSDAFGRGAKLLGGGLLNPGIGGRSYYNTWLRWGHGGYFGELNFILVREPVGDSHVTVRTLGVSVGLPLATFL